MAPGLQHFQQADYAKLHIYNGNQDIQIGDVHSSINEDPNAPITSGFFNLEKGCKATTTFPFSEHKYVISGTLIVSDQNGQRFTCRAGDCFYIPRGATITFETEEGGKAYFVGQRAANESRIAQRPSKI